MARLGDVVDLSKRDARGRTGPHTGQIHPMANWKPALRLPREFLFDQLSKMIRQNTFLDPLDDFVQETAH